MKPQASLDVWLKKDRVSRNGECFQLEVTFSAAPGITILLGHSGAGKSTLLQSIAGLCNPDQGRIAIGERVLFDSTRKIDLEPRRRNVAFVFQDLALFPHLTVHRNVGYGLRHLHAAERERRVSSILRSFQIGRLRDRLPRQISGGEQQRVALARSLVTEPSVLLLDEPLSSLDVRTKSSIIDDLRSWNEARCIPILYVTHNHSEVLALGERLIVLDSGRIVSKGAPLDVLPTLQREMMAQAAGFENVLEATVLRLNPSKNTMTCRITGTCLEWEAPITRVEPGAEVLLGIRSSEILLATTRPEMVGGWNIVPGRLLRLERTEFGTEARVDCGAELRAHVSAQPPESCAEMPHTEAWIMIRPDACHLIRKGRLSPLQRLFVFVCGGNTTRSPMAQAICNAEIAAKLKLPIQAVSAGLSATPGQPMSKEAVYALCGLSVPVHEHRSQTFNSELAARAEAVFCMTQKQCETVRNLFPSVAAKTFRLHPDQDLEEPTGHSPEACLQLAKQIQAVIQQRLSQA